MRAGSIAENLRNAGGRQRRHWTQRAFVNRLQPRYEVSRAAERGRRLHSHTARHVGNEVVAIIGENAPGVAGSTDMGDDRFEPIVLDGGDDCLWPSRASPDAIVGGILALYLSGLNFSISAAIGFVSLFGVSVMDGILMITFYNQERLHGFAPEDAMFRAASTRMRPLLMTALSACIGLLPAAISTGIGSQVQRPLATVIVGGMLVGPVMLLLAVPALRMIFLGHDNHHSSGESK